MRRQQLAHHLLDPVRLVRKLPMLLLCVAVPFAVIAATGDFLTYREDYKGNMKQVRMSADMVAAMNGVQAVNVTTAANGTYTWTFPQAYKPGVLPVVNVTAFIASTTVYTNCQVTARSNTSCTVFVGRMTKVGAV